MSSIITDLSRGVNGSISDVSPLGNAVREFPNANESVDAKAVTSSRLPEIVIYEHIDFGGAKERTNLAWSWVGGYWNDKISSIVVVNGVWEFYEHINYGGKKWTLGEGYYRWVVAAGIPNDVISSFKPISW
jgi:hypothetical protein